MRFSHKTWTFSDHQPKVRNDYEDLSRKKPGISTQSKWVSFFFSKKLLTADVNPRQIKFGVLWAKTIRDYTVYTTGIFNSASVSEDLKDDYVNFFQFACPNCRRSIRKSWSLRLTLTERLLRIPVV